MAPLIICGHFRCLLFMRVFPFVSSASLIVTNYRIRFILHSPIPPEFEWVNDCSIFDIPLHHICLLEHDTKCNNDSNNPEAKDLLLYIGTKDNRSFKIQLTQQHVNIESILYYLTLSTVIAFPNLNEIPNQPFHIFDPEAEWGRMGVHQDDRVTNYKQFV